MNQTHQRAYANRFRRIFTMSSTVSFSELQFCGSTLVSMRMQVLMNFSYLDADPDPGLTLKIPSSEMDLAKSNFIR
jgi:hypothetical protein